MRCATHTRFPRRLRLRSPPPSALLLMTCFHLHLLHSRPPRHSRGRCAARTCSSPLTLGGVCLWHQARPCTALDFYHAALQALGNNTGTVGKDGAAWREYWVPLTELLGVARWRENPTIPLTPFCRKHACCARCCFWGACHDALKTQAGCRPSPTSGYTASSSRFGVCNPVRAGTWLRRSTCVAPWMACSSN
eukprot:6185185-Pleurochrysis_carterae.AAC.1